MVGCKLERSSPVYSDYKRYTKQEGSVLVVALLLLGVLTVLVVASMSGTLMQERMAGNVNLQTLAFEAASAGVAESARFADPATWSENEACRRGEPGWKEDWSAFEPLPDVATEGATVAYRQRIGCFEAEGNDDAWGEGGAPMQLLVLNQGVVCSGNALSGCETKANLLSVREIEVRVERFGGKADCMVEVGEIELGGCGKGVGGGKCAIQMPTSQEGDIRIDATEVGGCPIRTSDGGSANEMLRILEHGNDLTGYYQPQPAVRAETTNEFWQDPVKIARAVNAIKVGVLENRDGAPEFSQCAGDFNLDRTDCPTEAITYVAGDLTLGGGCRSQGVVFVEGQIEFNGNVGYEGDIIGLGGHLDVNGMGGAASTGLLRLVNLEGDVGKEEPAYNESDPAFKNSDFDFQKATKFNISGMGNATIGGDEVDCQNIRKRWEDLNECLKKVGDEKAEFAALSDKGNRFPVPECDGKAFGGSINGIVSWREYIDRKRWPHQ